VRRSDPLALDELVAEADRHAGGAASRPRDLAAAHATGSGIVLLDFETDDEEAFLDLAWIEIDATRLLTSGGGPRTLRAVATRILSDFGTFDRLIGSSPQPGLDPGWFASCARIENEGFDWDRWTKPWLVPACPSEQRSSPRTEYYIWEGVHSCLALAVGLVSERIEWRPLTAVLCLERPSK
jgi:hypothetical protein